MFLKNCVKNMSNVKKEPEKPSELTFKADGKTFTCDEIVKVLRQLGRKDLDSTAIRDAFKLDKETGRDSVRNIMW